MKKENKTKTSWEKEFDKVVDWGLEFGIFDYSRVKSFIRTLLANQRRQLVEEIRQEFVNTAIEGAEDPDKLKGLYLYSRFLTLLDDKLKEGK